MFQIDLSGQVAWITGASRGIGRAMALAFADAGAYVALGFNANEGLALEVAEIVRSKGAKVMTVQVDVACPDSCAAAFEAIKSDLGAVDVLVNNAGVTADNLFLMLEPADWAKVVNTNIFGVVNVTKVVLADMLMKRRGRIINMSSVAATLGGRGQSNYAATKGAIEAMTRSLAVELASRNITVNCIAPGVIETDMSAEVVKLAREEIMKRLLIKRLGKPDEIAAWAVMLASRYGEFMTGQVVHVDGGFKMP